MKFRIPPFIVPNTQVAWWVGVVCGVPIGALIAGFAALIGSRGSYPTTHQLANGCKPNLADGLAVAADDASQLPLATVKTKGRDEPRYSHGLYLDTQGVRGCANVSPARAKGLAISGMGLQAEIIETSMVNDQQGSDIAVGQARFDECWELEPDVRRQ